MNASIFWLSAKCVENGTHWNATEGVPYRTPGESVGNGLRAVPELWHFNTSDGEPIFFIAGLPDLDSRDGAGSLRGMRFGATPNLAPEDQASGARGVTMRGVRNDQDIARLATVKSG